jgi:zinc protease
MREAVGSDRDFLFAQGGYDGHQSAGLFYALGVLRPGADSAAAERGLAARVEKLAAEPVTAEELERARRQAEGGILFAWQGVHGRTLALGLAQIVDGDYRGAWTRLERVRALAAADLQRAAARVLKPENRGVVWLVPGGAPGPAPAPPVKGSER